MMSVPFDAKCDYVEVSSSPLDIRKIRELVRRDAGGAISIFDGITRNNFNGKGVDRLEYEAYESMARKEMQKICVRMRQKWDLLSVALVHRVGVCPIGESSVLVACCSAHRREAIEACHYGIDEIKRSVPIWKKEFYTHEYADESVWKANAEAIKPQVRSPPVSESSSVSKPFQIPPTLMFGILVCTYLSLWSIVVVVIDTQANSHTLPCPMADQVAQWMGMLDVAQGDSFCVIEELQWKFFSDMWSKCIIAQQDSWPLLLHHLGGATVALAVLAPMVTQALALCFGCLVMMLSSLRVVSLPGDHLVVVLNKVLSTPFRVVSHVGYRASYVACQSPLITFCWARELRVFPTASITTRAEWFAYWYAKVRALVSQLIVGMVVCVFVVRAAGCAMAGASRCTTPFGSDAIPPWWRQLAPAWAPGPAWVVVLLCLLFALEPLVDMCARIGQWRRALANQSTKIKAS
mmetsp:Transcript_151332/g.264387  ORF Transcript_151332/g.264387 Transcript_151332/m.264387 type:complete len:463 (-) Transcript_151332:305-1693(-)